MGACQVPAYFSFPRISLLVSVSPPGRNPFQQWEDMEGDTALLPHDPEKFWDGEEEPLGLVHWKRASSPVEAGTAGYL